MFKRRATVSSKPTFYGWSEAHILYLAEKFTSETGVGHLGVNVTGIESIAQLRLSYGSSEYSVKSKIELVGRSDWPPARFEGSFGVENTSEGQEMGTLSITGKGSVGGPFIPLINAHFGVRSNEQESELIHNLQTALTGKGAAWLNFSLKPLDENERGAWVESIKTRGYSPSLTIVGVVVGTQIGGPFD